MKSMYLLYASLLLCLIFLSPRDSFSQGSGSINGFVTDSSGAGILDASIVATNLKNGIIAKTKSVSSGSYTFPSLEPGDYSVGVQATGFTSQLIGNVKVDIASPVTLDFTLNPGGVKEVVQVTAQADLINATTATLGSKIEDVQLTELPTNGRDYGRFTLYSPGAVLGSNYLYALTFNGSQTVQNAYSIDGVDATRVDEPYMSNGNERGARLLTGSLESVSEFNIQTNGYQAQYGRANGASMNIVTKSGGDKFHGTLFDYLRNDAFDARNFFATSGVVPKPEFRFSDFGANIGGPMHSQKAFFFVNYEGDRQILGSTITGTVPSALLRQEVVATSPALEPIVNLMPKGTSPSGDPAGLIDNYVATKTSNIREDTGTVRLDQHLGEKDFVFERLNINDSLVSGPRAAATPRQFGLTDYMIVPIRTTNIAVHEQHTFAANLLNDLLIGMQRVASTSDANNGFPTTNITGLTITPGETQYQRRVATLFQLNDNVTLVKGHHTWVVGGSVYYLREAYRTAQILNQHYGSIQDFIDNKLSTASAGSAQPATGTIAVQYSAFAQDTWKLARKLTLDLGLRYDIEPALHESSKSAQSFDTQAGTLLPPGAPYYEHAKANFAPRLGVAWSATDKTVVRASFGMFYMLMTPGSAVLVPLNTIPGNVTLLGSQIPGLSYPFTSFITSGTPGQQTMSGFTPQEPDTYTQQYNLSVQQQLTRSTAFTLAYVGSHGLNEYRINNINLLDPETGARPLSEFGDVYIQYQNGQSHYNGFQASLVHRSSSGMVAQVNYTWAHSIDNVPDASNLQWTGPQDMTNIAAEKGNSDFDVRQNFSTNVIYPIPLGAHHKFLGNAPRPLQLIMSDWTVAGNALINSGVAGTVYIGDNTRGDGNYINQRPDCTGQPIYAADRSWHQWLNPAAFSYPAPGTFGNCGRNTFHQPGLVQIDSALIRVVPLGERKRLEFRAEFFNILNHPNFGAPQSYYSPGDPSFGVVYSTFGKTIGTGTPRQIEFALRFSF